MSDKTIGIIGLGNMGHGIAENFIRAKYQTMVWDLSSNATQPFNNRAQIAEPHMLASQCDSLFFVVPGSTEIAALLNGENGVLANAKPGLVLIDLTTSDPTYTKKLAVKANQHGIDYLDAGMSGGADGAKDGTLALMIGGDRSAFEQSRNHLDVFTKALFYLGESGLGHTMKLIHNMVCHTNFLAVCEAGHLAEHAGIALKDMIDVFNYGNARSFISEKRFPDHILSDTWDAKSRVYNLNKDVAMATSLANKLGAVTSLGNETSKFLNKAVAMGMQDQDFSLLYREFEKINNS